ncbi:MAG: cation diffusion facilitator family transporter [Patescibacteria group bacterium]
MPRLMKYLIILVLTTAALIVEIIGSKKSHSLSLLSDAVHVFIDLISIILAITTYLLARKFEKIAKKISGWGGIISALLLLPAIGFIGFEAVERFFNPTSIKSDVLVISAVVGTMLNFLGILIMAKEHGIIHEHNHAEEAHSVTDNALISHIKVDLYSSCAVVIGSLIIFMTGQNWIDSVLSVGISIFLLGEVYKVIAKSRALLIK